MATDEPRADPDATQADRRRSRRFLHAVPVDVKWNEPGGASVRGDAQAKEVNAYGGLLQMKTYPPVGGEVELTNYLSAATTRARVVAIRRSKEGAVLGVGVELLSPSDHFWGVTFHVKRISAELLALEEAIKSGGIELRVLREFRDAVDYVRKTAWAVQEWQERQLKHRDMQTVLPLLTAERIRRSTQLSQALAAELDERKVTCETPGIAELFQALQQVYQRLTSLFESREAD